MSTLGTPGTAGNNLIISKNFPWTAGTTGRGGIFAVAPADVACGWFDDMFDPNTSGHTGGRAGQEQAGLRKELKWREPHDSGQGLRG